VDGRAAFARMTLARYREFRRYFRLRGRGTLAQCIAEEGRGRVLRAIRSIFYSEKSDRSKLRVAQPEEAGSVHLYAR